MSKINSYLSFQDNQYDSNYQQSRVLSQEIAILPGDGLVSECTYSTGKREDPILGGLRAKDEACLILLLHYPRTPLADCVSMPPVKYFFHTFGVKEFYDKDMGQVNKMFLEERLVFYLKGAVIYFKQSNPKKFSRFNELFKETMTGHRR